MEATIKPALDDGNTEVVSSRIPAIPGTPHRRDNTLVVAELLKVDPGDT
jgi:hypothetical protein